MSGTSLFDQVVAKIRELLDDCGPDELVLELRGDSLSILPQAPNSFEITVYDDGDEVIIAAQRWHGHEEEVIQAAWCVMWLLTPFYRIVEEFKGAQIIAVWTERYDLEGWEMIAPVYFLNPDHPSDWIPLGDEVFTRRIHQQAVFGAPEEHVARFGPGQLDAEELPIGTVLGTQSIRDGYSQALEEYQAWGEGVASDD